MSRLSRYSPEVRERAVRLVREHGAERPVRRGPRSSRLRASWGARPRRSGSGSGRPSAIPGSAVASDDRGNGQRTKELEREVRELKRINEILRKASAYFAQAELDRRPR